MLNQTGLLHRRHPVVLWLYREKYHNFKSQHNIQSQSKLNLQASDSRCIWFRIWVSFD